MTTHPCLDNLGNKVHIGQPHQPSSLSAWDDPGQVAVVVPGGATPSRLNHVFFRPWTEAPADRGAWDGLACDQEMKAEDLPFEAKGLPAAAGAVVVEADGRVWVVAPTNAFGGSKATFPKGHANGLGLRAAAIKEVFEESGLRVEILGHLIDVTRSTTRTRYYLARRIGGTPSDMGWESQAVMLAPVKDLKKILNKPVDHRVVDALLERLRGACAQGIFATSRPR